MGLKGKPNIEMLLKGTHLLHISRTGILEVLMDSVETCILMTCCSHEILTESFLIKFSRIIGSK